MHACMIQADAVARQNDHRFFFSIHVQGKCVKSSSAYLLTVGTKVKTVEN